MKKCYKCEASEDKTLLYEGISKEGVVFVCRKCYYECRIPLVETKVVDMSEVNKRQSVRERLVILSGLKNQKEEVKKPEESAELRKIVEENFKKNLLEDSIICERLVDKFHWVVMRKRRSMKLTQKEFADKIFEPSIVVEHLEKGVLPKDYIGLIKKVESVLDVSLLKEGERRLIPSHLANESKVSTGLRISDLKGADLVVAPKGVPPIEEGGQVGLEEGNEIIEPEELDLKEIEKIVGKPLEEVEGKKEMELSDDEIRRLIFRK